MSKQKQTTLFQSWGQQKETKDLTVPKQTSCSSTTVKAVSENRAVIDLCDSFDDEEEDGLLLQAEDTLLHHGNHENNGHDIGHSEFTTELDQDEGADGENVCNISVGAEAFTPTQGQSQVGRLQGFDLSAGKLWIYPTNYPVREYQFDIVGQCLFKNTMVTLPTGLGKTFIAAVVMYNFYRWYPQGKIIFMAPTKPLVAQQIEACYNIMGIPQTDTAEMTGSMGPPKRQKAWHEKRVFFLTPQVLTNDLSRGSCPAVDVRCLVIDEAHKSLGNHAYCQVVRELVKYTELFRVLALSATPGSDIKAVQQVLTNLLISHIEIRTEESADIKQYSHERKVDKIVIPLGDELSKVKAKYIHVMDTVISRLKRYGVIYNRDTTSFSKFLILKSREAFRQNPPERLQRSQYGVVEGDFALAMSLYHGFELLQLHGSRSLFNFLQGVLTGEKSYGRTRTELMKIGDFRELMDMLSDKYSEADESVKSSQAPNKALVLGHPKMGKLQEIVLEHFASFVRDKRETRVMIFSQYRDSVKEITDMLQQHKPMVKVMSFIGQSSAGKSTKGFTQKEQLQVMKKFREGGYNTLVSTCVGEEGLDIGDVDLIICFDAHKSPIRLVQRMGRTGRKREGRIVMLVTEGKEEQVYNQSQYSKRSIHKAILNGARSLHFYQHSPKMIPDQMNPSCHKMFITVKDSFKPTRKVPQEIDENRVTSKQPSVDGRRAQPEVILTPAEYRELQSEWMVPEDTVPRLPQSHIHCLTPDNQNDAEVTSEGQQLSMSEWLPWQNRLQPTDMIDHSLSSRHLVQLMEFIELQQTFDKADDPYGQEMALYLDEDDILKPGEEDSAETTLQKYLNQGADQDVADQRRGVKSRNSSENRKAQEKAARKKSRRSDRLLDIDIEGCRDPESEDELPAFQLTHNQDGKSVDSGEEMEVIEMENEVEDEELHANRQQQQGVEVMEIQTSDEEECPKSLVKAKSNQSVVKSRLEKKGSLKGKRKSVVKKTRKLLNNRKSGLLNGTRTIVELIADTDSNDFDQDGGLNALNDTANDKESVSLICGKSGDLVPNRGKPALSQEEAEAEERENLRLSQLFPEDPVCAADTGPESRHYVVRTPPPLESVDSFMATLGDTQTLPRLDLVQLVEEWEQENRDGRYIVDINPAVVRSGCQHRARSGHRKMSVPECDISVGISFTSSWTSPLNSDSKPQQGNSRVSNSPSIESQGKDNEMHTEDIMALKDKTADTREGNPCDHKRQVSECVVNRDQGSPPNEALGKEYCEKMEMNRNNPNVDSRSVLTVKKKKLLRQTLVFPLENAENTNVHVVHRKADESSENNSKFDPKKRIIDTWDSMSNDETHALQIDGEGSDSIVDKFQKVNQEHVNGMSQTNLVQSVDPENTLRTAVVSNDEVMLFDSEEFKVSLDNQNNCDNPVESKGPEGSEKHVPEETVNMSLGGIGDSWLHDDTDLFNVVTPPASEAAAAESQFTFTQCLACVHSGSHPSPSRSHDPDPELASNPKPERKKYASETAKAEHSSPVSVSCDKTGEIDDTEKAMDTKQGLEDDEFDIKSDVGEPEQRGLTERTVMSEEETSRSSNSTGGEFPQFDLGFDLDEDIIPPSPKPTGKTQKVVTKRLSQVFSTRLSQSRVESSQNRTAGTVVCGDVSHIDLPNFSTRNSMDESVKPIQGETVEMVLDKDKTSSNSNKAEHKVTNSVIKPSDTGAEFSLGVIQEVETSFSLLDDDDDFSNWIDGFDNVDAKPSTDTIPTEPAASELGLPLHTTAEVETSALDNKHDMQETMNLSESTRSFNSLRQDKLKSKKTKRVSRANGRKMSIFPEEALSPDVSMELDDGRVALGVQEKDSGNHSNCNIMSPVPSNTHLRTKSSTPMSCRKGGLISDMKVNVSPFEVTKKTQLLSQSGDMQDVEVGSDLEDSFVVHPRKKRIGILTSPDTSGVQTPARSTSFANTSGNSDSDKLGNVSRHCHELDNKLDDFYDSVILPKKNSLNKRRKIVISDESEDDFDNTSVITKKPCAKVNKQHVKFKASDCARDADERKPDVKRKVKHKVKTDSDEQRKKRTSNPFIEEEADESEDASGMSSDENEGSDLDQYEGSFIQDSQFSQSQAINTTDIHAVYLESVRSPPHRGAGKFKLQYDYNDDVDVYSQHPQEDESQYMEDSFCVGEEDEEGEASVWEDPREVTMMDPVLVTQGGRTRRQRTGKALQTGRERAQHAAKVSALNEIRAKMAGRKTKFKTPSCDNDIPRQAKRSKVLSDTGSSSEDSLLGRGDSVDTGKKSICIKKSEAPFMLSSDEEEFVVARPSVKHTGNSAGAGKGAWLNTGASVGNVSARDERLRKQKEKQEEFRRKMAAKSVTVHEEQSKVITCSVMPMSNQVSSVESVENVEHTKIKDRRKKPDLSETGGSESKRTSSSSDQNRPTCVTKPLTCDDDTDLLLSTTTTGSRDSSKLILVDSKEISGSQEIVSSLRFKHKVHVSAASIVGCDYVVSNRMAVERKQWSEFSNGANRAKLVERMLQLGDLYDRPCLIVEKDRVKPGEEKSAKPQHWTKYVDRTIAQLLRSEVKVMFTQSQLETAALLADLCQVEQRKGVGITAPVDLSQESLNRVKFYVSIPKVSYVHALNLSYGFMKVSDFLRSSVTLMQKKGHMSESRACEVHKYVARMFDSSMLPTSYK